MPNARLRSGILPALVSYAGSRDTGSPKPPRLETGRRGAAPTVEPAYVTSAAIFTRTPGIVPLFAWRASARWC